MRYSCLTKVVAEGWTGACRIRSQSSARRYYLTILIASDSPFILFLSIFHFSCTDFTKNCYYSGTRKVEGRIQLLAHTALWIFVSLCISFLDSIWCSASVIDLLQVWFLQSGTVGATYFFFLICTNWQLRCK